MPIQSSFTLRFKLPHVGFKFFAEEECANHSELHAAFKRLDTNYARSAQLEIELDSARIMPDLSSIDGANSFSLEDSTEVLVATICKSLNVGQESFMNERLGSYDPHNNRVEPLFMGNTFPNGCRYLVWRDAESGCTFDAAIVFFEQLFTFLVLSKHLPYFNFTEDEFNDSESSAPQARLQDALFELGMWPCDDPHDPFPDLLDTFDELPKRVEDALARYATMTPVSA